MLQDGMQNFKHTKTVVKTERDLFGDQAFRSTMYGFDLESTGGRVEAVRPLQGGLARRLQGQRRRAVMGHDTPPCHHAVTPRSRVCRHRRGVGEALVVPRGHLQVTQRGPRGDGGVGGAQRWRA